MITEAAIKSALKTAPNSGKSSIELKDDGMRGEGRLALLIRVSDTRVSAEWYAVWFRNGKRKVAKIGGYPLMPLADARKVFREDYAPLISRGENPEGVRARKKRDAPASDPTVLDLFTAYIEHLKKNGQRWVDPKKYLIGSPRAPTGRWKGRKTTSAATAIGPTKPAKEITHRDVKPHLAEIHKRGAVSSAAHARAFISAAFSFAMASANAYHQTAGEVDWGVTVNPCSAIPVDPNSKKVGTRYLTTSEYRLFWNWLADPVRASIAVPVLQMIMLTGQRVQEIIGLTDNPEVAERYEALGVRMGLFDPIEKILDWSNTKNGDPHTLPLPQRAVDLMKVRRVNVHGLYFPQRRHPIHVQTISAPEQLVEEFLKQHPGFAKFTPRDLRRTWKTLAGAAGLSKDIRDRLQNHAKSDVSSRHYDRYEYMAEKRAAVETWAAYVERILDGELDLPVTPLRARA
jgi:integrase